MLSKLLSSFARKIRLRAITLTCNYLLYDDLAQANKRKNFGPYSFFSVSNHFFFFYSGTKTKIRSDIQKNLVTNPNILLRLPKI
jgi:hypothetical protein